MTGRTRQRQGNTHKRVPLDLAATRAVRPGTVRQLSDAFSHRIAVTASRRARALYWQALAIVPSCVPQAVITSMEQTSGWALSQV